MAALEAVQKPSGETTFAALCAARVVSPYLIADDF